MNDRIQITITNEKLLDYFMHAATRDDIAQFRVEVNASHSELRAEINAFKVEITLKINKLETEFNERFEKLEARINERFEKLEARMDKLESRMDRLEDRMQSLEVKIEQYKYDSLKFTVWTGIGVVATLGGMMAKGFHWIG